jgi:hypothetical protein
VEKGYEPPHDLQFNFQRRGKLLLAGGAEYHVGFRLSIARDFKTVMKGLAVWKQILVYSPRKGAKLNPNIINFNKLSRLMILGSLVMVFAGQQIHFITKVLAYSDVFSSN